MDEILELKRDLARLEQRVASMDEAMVRMQNLIDSLQTALLQMVNKMHKKRTGGVRR